MYTFPLFVLIILLIKLGPEVKNCGFHMFFSVVIHTFEGIFTASVVYLHVYHHKEVNLKMVKYFICCVPKREAVTLNDISVAPNLSKNGFVNQELFVGPALIEKLDKNSINWQDVVMKARNSIHETVLVEKSASPEAAPKPRFTMKEIVLRATGTLKENLNNSEEQSSPSTAKKKFSMKEIVLLAKNSRSKETWSKNLSAQEKFRKSSEHFKSFGDEPSTPPLPKDIPDQILDDIQLFDFYYNNLDNFRVSTGSSSNKSSIAPKNIFTEESPKINSKKFSSSKISSNSFSFIEEINDNNHIV